MNHAAFTEYGNTVVTNCIYIQNMPSYKNFNIIIIVSTVDHLWIYLSFIQNFFFFFFFYEFFRVTEQKLHVLFLPNRKIGGPEPVELDFCVKTSHKQLWAQ